MLFEQSITKKYKAKILDVEDDKQNKRCLLAMFDALVFNLDFKKVNEELLTDLNKQANVKQSMDTLCV